LNFVDGDAEARNGEIKRREQDSSRVDAEVLDERVVMDLASELRWLEEERRLAVLVVGEVA